MKEVRCNNLLVNILHFETQTCTEIHSQKTPKNPKSAAFFHTRQAKEQGTELGGLNFVGAERKLRILSSDTLPETNIDIAPEKWGPPASLEIPDLETTIFSDYVCL